MSNNIKPVYELIERVLGDKYTVGWQYMAEDKECTAGIYLYESSSDLRYMGGDYGHESIKAHVQVQARGSETGLFEALEYLRDFVDKIESGYHSNDGVSFEDCQHVGPKAIVVGTNTYGIKICRTVIDIKYLLK